MNILASGSENVQRLQEALGRPVPKEAGKKSLASLQKIARERYEREQKRRAEFAELQARAQAPLWGLIQKDEKALESVRKLRDLPVLIPAQPGCPPAPPFVMESSLRAGSHVVVRVPPYDDAFADAFGSADSWATVPEPGICGFKLGQGPHDGAMNGVGVWFWSISDNPLTRFSAFLYYCFTWSDQSVVYPAFNEASVNLWVWGDQENAWLVQQGGLYPSWNDSTSGFEVHRNAQDASGVVQAFFPARAFRWYFGWVWLSGSTDEYSGPSGFSNAKAFLNLRVSYVVFEQ